MDGTAQQGQRQQPPQEDGFLGRLLSQLPRFMLLYFAFNYFTQSQQPLTAPPPVASPSQDGVQAPVTSFPPQFTSIWKLGQTMDLYFYTSTKESIKDFEKPVVVEKSIKFGDWNDIRRSSFEIECPESVQNNGSLFGHFYMVESGAHLAKLPSERIIYHRKLLTRYMPKRKETKKKNLITSDESSLDEKQEPVIQEEGPQPIVSYWWRNISLNIVANDQPIPSKLPPLVLKNVRLDSTGTKYYPILTTNDFWMLTSDLMPINSTVK
jgi:hypothetical protein